MIKYFKVTLIVSIIFLSMACSNLQIKTKIEEGKFRFENFQVLSGPQLESISLLCYRKKPTDWHGARQYDAGKQTLLVKAIIKYEKQAYVTFNIKLAAGQNYILNRTIVGDKISIWIEEKESGLKVSTIETASLELINRHKMVYEAKEEKKACKASSV